MRDPHHTTRAEVVVRSDRVVTPDGERPAAIHIRDGRITTVAPYDAVMADSPVIDAGGMVVLPGLVDTHVHINAPGRTAWEGFETATRAAAAGGITTLVDMPLNGVPATTSLAGLEAKLAAAERQCWVDVAFWGGVVPGNAGELALLHKAGVVGFKCFLCPSGVDEFPCVTEAELREVLPTLAALDAPLLVHAELASALRTVPSGPGADPRRYSTYLATRPATAEREAVALLVRLAREFGVRIHIVHVASAELLPVLRTARREGLRVTAETCPHYLHFAASAVPDGATQFKCAPPIRSLLEREGLWRGLREGLIELVVSDHSPAPPELKSVDTGDFLAAWGGIASLQLGLGVMWSEIRARGGDVTDIANWMSAAPARLAGIDDRKGAIAPGRDADLVLWEPEAEMVVEPSRLEHRHKLTPYAGERLAGTVRATMLRGRFVFDAGRFAARPHGRAQLRSARRTLPPPQVRRTRDQPEREREWRGSLID